MADIWVLVAGVNDHHQHGEYFVAAFNEKPTFDELRAVVEGDVRDEGIERILEGQCVEDAPEPNQGHWFEYWLVQIKHGAKYTRKHEAWLF